MKLSEKSNNRIPLLPVGVVAFPGEICRLRVTEGKYLQLLHECEENNLKVGLIPVVRKRLFAYGTVVELQSLLRNKTNGSIYAEFRGEKIFRLRNYRNKFSGKTSYPGADITYPKEQEILPSLFLQKLSERVFRQIQKLLQEKLDSLLAEPQDAVVSGESRKEEDISSFFMINRLVGLHLEEKAIFLAMRSEEKRFTLLYDQMKRLLEVTKAVLI